MIRVWRRCVAFFRLAWAADDLCRRLDLGGHAANMVYGFQTRCVRCLRENGFDPTEDENWWRLFNSRFESLLREHLGEVRWCLNNMESHKAAEYCESCLNRVGEVMCSRMLSFFWREKNRRDGAYK